MLDEVKKRQRQINAIGAAGVLLLLAGTGVFGVAPLISTGRQNMKATAALNKSLTELDVLTVKLSKVEVERKSREARLIQAEEKLPTVASLNQFVPELATVAESAGLQVDQVTPTKEVKDAGKYKTMSVLVSGRGDWATCYKFLTGLRGEDRQLTRLEGLTLETLEHDKAVDKPLCRITVDISTLMAR
jgi:Tfp pilus assembly protein PilO